MKRPFLEPCRNPSATCARVLALVADWIRSLPIAVSRVQTLFAIAAQIAADRKKRDYSTKQKTAVYIIMPASGVSRTTTTIHHS
jgi:hypothetical protein